MTILRVAICLLGIYSGVLSEELNVTNVVSAPLRLLKPLTTYYTQVNNVGPPSPYPRAKAALLLPEISLIADPQVDSIMDDIREGLQYVLQTKNDFTFPIHGTGTTSMSAIFDNLVEPGDKVLVLSIGHWGDTMVRMSNRYGAEVVHLNKTRGTRFFLNEVEEALDTYKPDILSMVMGESVVGVLQPMEGVGELTRKRGVLLIVDFVAAVGMVPVKMDKWKIDAIYSNSHKGIGAATGLGIVSLNSIAVKKLNNRRIPPRSFHTDLTMEVKTWNTTDRKFLHAMSLPLMYSLRAALSTIAEEGLENVLQRHADATKQLSDGMAAMGLEHFVPSPEDRLTGITTTKLPKGKDPYKIVDFMLKNSRVAINPGYGPLRGQLLMIGTMAHNSDTTRVNILLTALKKAIRSNETNVNSTTV